MLTRLKVQGCKSLADVGIRFGPLTCIAGANGAGQSNLFDAILLLRYLADLPIAEAAARIRNSGSHRCSRKPPRIARPRCGADLLSAGGVADDSGRRGRPPALPTGVAARAGQGRPSGRLGAGQGSLDRRAGGGGPGADFDSPAVFRASLDAADGAAGDAYLDPGQSATERRDGAAGTLLSRIDTTDQPMALAAIGADASSGGLICVAEPEKRLDPARMAAVVELLRPSAADPALAAGADNPRRQMMLNTHSAAAGGRGGLAGLPELAAGWRPVVGFSPSARDLAFAPGAGIVRRRAAARDQRAARLPAWRRRRRRHGDGLEYLARTRAPAGAAGRLAPPMPPRRCTRRSDGSSDSALLPIIGGLIARHCPDLGVSGQLAHGPGAVGLALKQRIPPALRMFPCDTFCVHRDAEGAALDLRLDEIVRAMDAVQAQFAPVIPARMTEAWPLSDTMAIRSAAGNASGRGDLSLPPRPVGKPRPTPQPSCSMRWPQHRGKVDGLWASSGRSGSASWWRSGPGTFQVCAAGPRAIVVKHN